VLDSKLETALLELERTRHTARSPCERRTRPRGPAPLRTGAAGARAWSCPGRPPAGRLALRARPLPAPHSRAAKRGPFRWQSKAGSVTTVPSFESKGCRTSAVACGARKNDTKKITAAGSDFTAERCLQLTAPFFRHPVNPLALYSCHQKGTWLTTRMFRLGARPCLVAAAHDL
jgi:hypothetical protein